MPVRRYPNRAHKPDQSHQVGIDVNEVLGGLWNVDQAVTTRFHLAEPGAQQDHHIGRFNPRGQLGVDPDTGTSSIERVGIVKEILAPERRRNGHRPFGGEILKV